MSKQKSIPQLRFPKFEGEWKEDIFGKYVIHSVFGPRFSSDLYGNEGNIATLRTTDMDLEGNICYETMPLANLEFDQIKDHILESNDIVISRSGTIGITGVFKNYKMKVVPGAFLIRFRVDNQKISTDFIKLQFNSTKGRNILNTLSAGGVQKNLTGTSVKQLEIIIPSLPEQQKIASFLSAVDEKIQQLSRKKELLDQYKKGVLQQLFSGKLRFKDENGEDFSDWEENILRDVLKINQGLQIAITERFTEPIENGYFYITNEFLRSNSQKKYYIKSPPDSVICYVDDILMTRTGNTGQVVTGVHGAFHNNFFKISLNGNCSKWFLYHFLKSKRTQHIILKLAGTSTIPDLNHGDFYKIKIKLPSIPEQQKIANFLSSIDTKIENVNKQLAQTQTFKKGLLQQMFV